MIRGVFPANRPAIAALGLAGCGSLSSTSNVVLRRVLLLVVGVFAFACGEQSPGQGPTSPSVTPQPPTIPVTGPTLSGRVYEVTPQGLRAVSFGNVWYSLDSGGGKTVNLDTSGRYTIAALPTGSRVRLTANSPSLQQTCAVYTVFEAADTVQDIKLVRSGSQDAMCEGPTLSGVVFRIVYGVKSNAWVGWDAFLDTVVAETRTDPQGRYRLCGIPMGKIDGLFAVRVNSNRPVYRSVGPGADAVVDFELP